MDCVEAKKLNDEALKTRLRFLFCDKRRVQKSAHTHVWNICITPTPLRPSKNPLIQTGSGKVPAQLAISFFKSLISCTSPPATLALKSFSLFASFGSFP